MDIIIGFILILSFIGLVYYCIKGHNLMIGFFIMTCIWVILSLIGNFVNGNEVILGYGDDLASQVKGVLKNVYQEGPQAYGSSILVNIFFGAFFGRVLVETNIADTLIRKVVEFGGDRPRVTLVLLCVVTALLFTSMTGIGPVISIAVIVIPILLTLGIPPTITLFSFMGSIMAGIFANITNFTQYIGIFSPSTVYTYQEYAWLGWTGFIVTLIVVLIISNIALSFFKVSYWAVDKNNNIIEPEDRKSKINTAPWYSFIAIIMPVLFVIIFDLPIILSFIIASTYALICCRSLKGNFISICKTYAKLFTDGAIDVAPMVGFLLCLAMFNNAANFVAPYFEAILGGVIPTNTLAIVLLFAFLMPLGFFRGPLNLVGCGVAMLAVIKAVNPGLPVEFLFPLFAISTIAPQHLDITQSWVAWGLSYTKIKTKNYLKLSIPTGWIVGFILCFIVYFTCKSLGVI